MSEYDRVRWPNATMHSIQGGTANSFYRDIMAHIHTVPDADWLKDPYGKYTKLNEDHVCIIFGILMMYSGKGSFTSQTRERVGAWKDCWIR